MERLWAGWRSAYLESSGGDAAPAADAAPGADGCVFCGLFASQLPGEETLVVWRSSLVVAVLNAFPYGSGHLLVMPVRHVADLTDVTGEERTALWDAVHAGVEAVTAAYRPGGVNVGANLGRAAGAGIPGHLHVHVLPRWDGDTNFMTAVADTRVLPEPLAATWRRLRDAWPAGRGLEFGRRLSPSPDEEEQNMAEASDWNTAIIEEFRSNGGKVGGQFVGAPLLLLHSTGAKTGQERVSPVMYQAVGDGYAIFASKAGAPTNPDWYHNLVAQPRATVEVGTASVGVEARVAGDDERERIWTKQKADYPGFAEYEEKTTRKIPVVILTPTS